MQLETTSKNIKSAAGVTERLSWPTIVVALAGFFYALSGMALLMAPVWFYENVGQFPPFNRHYMGDLGSFLLPLGLGLLWAARNPVAGRLLVIITLWGSLLHALNHAYDDWLAGVPWQHWFSETIPLLLLALLLFLAHRQWLKR